MEGEAWEALQLAEGRLHALPVTAPLTPPEEISASGGRCDGGAEIPTLLCPSCR